MENHEKRHFSRNFFDIKAKKEIIKRLFFSPTKKIIILGNFWEQGQNFSSYIPNGGQDLPLDIMIKKKQLHWALPKLLHVYTNIEQFLEQLRLVILNNIFLYSNLISLGLNFEWKVFVSPVKFDFLDERAFNFIVTMLKKCSALNFNFLPLIFLIHICMCSKYLNLDFCILSLHVIIYMYFNFTEWQAVRLNNLTSYSLEIKMSTLTSFHLKESY